MDVQLGSSVERITAAADEVGRQLAKNGKDAQIIHFGSLYVACIDKI